ncbi:MAG TPA: prepilin-type N-terminal cleavage/methylation domain-containing protein [Actinomycetota bacterium]|nr:prepilin-type N-terminal cleavage/methylation domain-containing protein [Actinomycetota bacterium]
MRLHDEAGFSLIEIMIGIFLFSLIGTGLVSVLFSVARGTETTARNVRVSEEARLGLNRMVRDVREAGWVQLANSNPAATHDSFTVKIDYDGDGAFTNPAAGTAQGSYEIVTYTYDAGADRITLTAPGVGTETIVQGVDCVRDAAAACKSNVFSFTSNRLEYDGNADGVTTLPEIDAAPCPPLSVTTLDVACSNGVLVDAELATITSLNVAVRLSAGGGSTDYYAEAQMRNRR